MIFDDKKKLENVVPCRTATRQGTAFYVGSKYFLTARHVVADILATNNGQWAYVWYGKKNLQCKAIEITIPSCRKDVALLECQDDIDEDWEKLTLTASEHNNRQDLLVVGFPQEALQGDTLVVLLFQNRIELAVENEHYDDLVVFKDDLDLVSYQGISGGPVLNSSGSVVGVVTYQHNHMVGYVPIKNVESLLEPYHITVAGDSFAENDKKVGNYTAKRQLQNSIDLVRSKYNKHLHQPMEGMDDIIDAFTLTDRKQIYLDFAKEIQTFAEEIQPMYDNPTIQNFCNKIEDAFHDNKGTDAILVCYQTDLDYELPSVQDKNRFKSLRDESLGYVPFIGFSQRRFLNIPASAGMGKTHAMCHYAEVIINEANVYLMFGAQFASGKTAKRTFLDNFNLEENDMAELNRIHEGRRRYAVIIIDALNEGGGNAYWNEQMEAFKEFLKPYPNIKLIVTYRNNIEKDLNCFDDDWISWTISGFANAEEAKHAYFKDYDIDGDKVTTEVSGFKEPLFLTAFCEAYKGGRNLPEGGIDRLALYKSYIKSRNKEVSKSAGEDPERNVTQLYLSDLAEKSVFDYHCDIIPREVARLKAEEITPNHLWDHHLLNATIKSNLLLQITRPDDEHFVMFEYEEMGDYLKAERFNESFASDAERWKKLIEFFQYVSNPINKANAEKFTNFQKALYSVWKQEGIDDKSIEEIKKLQGIAPLLDQMRTSKAESIRSAYNEIIKVKPMSPFELITNAVSLDENTLTAQHESLLKLTLAERDQTWTIGVNSQYGNISRLVSLSPKSGQNQQEKSNTVWIETWMLSSSFPNIRYTLIRSLVDYFKDDKDLIEYCLKWFYKVNDPYVIKGLMCAIYGCLLTTRGKNTVIRIVKNVHSYYQKASRKWTEDFQARQWYLHILELGFRVSPERCPYWALIKFPISNILNPFEAAKDIELTEKFIGKGNGSHRLWFSLSRESDFNRYILGSNSHNEISDLVRDDNGKSIKIEDVVKAMANIIVNDYKWNQALANYDSTVPLTSRYEQPVERIGKKYQWLSLHRVMAYLTDHCNIKKSFGLKDNEYYKKSYPWFSRYADLFDPAFPRELPDSGVVFKDIDENQDQICESSAQDWIDNNANVPIPILSRVDTFGNAWVNLGASITNNNKIGSDSINSFVFYNCYLIKNEDIKDFKDWAKGQDFGGRWMPEAESRYDFLWNEYPWSTTFTERYNSDVADYVPNNCPCELRHATVEQLQEHLEAIPNADNYPSRAFAPNMDMMHKMDLYTAERGIVRNNKDNSVVAFNGYNANIQDVSLWISAPVFNKYLEKKGFTLAIIICGEKSATQPEYKSLGVKHYSGCYLYKKGGKTECIQKIKVVELK